MTTTRFLIRALSGLRPYKGKEGWAGIWRSQTIGVTRAREGPQAERCQGVNVGSVTFSRNAAGLWPSSWVLRVLAGLVVPFTAWLMIKTNGSVPHQEAVLKSLLHKTHQKLLLRTLRRVVMSLGQLFLNTLGHRAI